MQPPNSEFELLKLRSDYAWKWFIFHADQRTKMFNFMLIVVGIFATAIVAAVKEGVLELVFWLCLVPGLLAIFFTFLDRRNQYLVQLGEDVLGEFEREHIFGEAETFSNIKGKQVPYGILWRQEVSERYWSRSRIIAFLWDVLGKHQLIGQLISKLVRYLRDMVLGKHRVWLRLIALLIGAFLLFSAWEIGSPPRWLSLGHRPSWNEHRYGAILDAGSSGSRLALFESRIAGDGAPHVWSLVSVEDDELGDCRLTSLPDKQATCDCLITLTKRARKNAEYFLGEPHLPPIPLWVKATAGVRTQSLDNQTKILNATNACLANLAGYEWKGAEVISGEMEGVYAWLAVNHVARTLRSVDGQNTRGIVELGGQSAQLAYRISPSPGVAPQHGKVVKIPWASEEIHIYAFSHDDLGSKAVREKTKNAGNACAPEAIPKKCKNEINSIITKFLCPQSAGENCLQLHPPSGMLYAGLSNFEYVAENMGLGTNASLEVASKRAHDICGPSKKTKILRDYVLAPAGKHAEGVCFNALYAAQLAFYGWGIPLENVSPPDAQWAGNPSWPLGAMIFEVARDTATRRSGSK